MNSTSTLGEPNLLSLITQFCKLHGRIVSERRLGLDDDAQLTAVDRIVALLTAQGFDVSLDQVELSTLRSEQGPWIINTPDRGFSLLRQVEGDTVTLRDASGKDQTVPATVLGIQRSLLVVGARPRFRTQARIGDFAKSSPGHWFWQPLWRHWRVFRDVGVAATVANCLAAAVALFAMQVYDRVVPTEAHDTLWVLAIGAVLAIVMEWLIRAARVTLLESAGQRLDQELGGRLFARAIGIRMAQVPRSPGSTVTQLREFESVREFFTSASTALLSDLPFVCLFIAAIAFIGGNLAFVPAAAIVLLILPALILQPFMSKLASESLRESACKNGLLWDAFSGIENVKACGAEGWLQRLWGDLHEQLSATTAKVRRLSQWIALWTMAMQQFAYVAVIVVGVYLIHASQLSVGGLIACSILVSRVIAPLSQASGLLSRWQHVKSALRSLDELMKAPVERPDDRQFVENPRLTGEILLEGIEWRPAEDQPPLIRIERLSLAAGETVAVLGPSGSGKSTLLRLLSGLLTPSGGQATVDSLNLEHLDPIDRRDQIAYMPQGIAIFQGTLRDNLNPSHLPLSDSVLVKLAESIGLGDFIQSRAMGLDTILSGRGELSGGQVQLIGLARVLVRNPRIVLLDEPTASLDQETEKKVIAALGRWGQGRTLIISTHKRALLGLVSRALVIKNGRLVMDSPAQQTTSVQKPTVAGAE
jgi:ATP-binding cassette, subfamily C, bacterial LapB